MKDLTNIAIWAISAFAPRLFIPATHSPRLIAMYCIASLFCVFALSALAVVIDYAVNP